MYYMPTSSAPAGRPGSLTLSRYVFVIFFATGVLRPGPGVAADIPQPLPRALHEIRLGMPLEQFIARFRTREQPADFPGERVFLVPPPGGSGIEGFRCTFSRGILYRIQTLYSEQYSARTEWGQLVDLFRGNFGEPSVVETPGGPIALWDDGDTSLALERHTDRYIASLTDNALFNGRRETCPPRREQV